MQWPMLYNNEGDMHCRLQYCTGINSVSARQNSFGVLKFLWLPPRGLSWGAAAGHCVMSSDIDT